MILRSQRGTLHSSSIFHPINTLISPPVCYTPPPSLFHFSINFETDWFPLLSESFVRSSHLLKATKYMLPSLPGCMATLHTWHVYQDWLPHSPPEPKVSLIDGWCWRPSGVRVRKMFEDRTHHYLNLCPDHWHSYHTLAPCLKKKSIWLLPVESKHARTSL